MIKKLRFILSLLLLIATMGVAASPIHSNMTHTQIKQLKSEINEALGRVPAMFSHWRSESEKAVRITNCKIIPSRKRVELYFNDALSQIGIREDLVLEWEQMVRDTLTHYLKESFDGVQVALYANSLPIEKYIPNAYRKKFKQDTKRIAKPYNGVPLVRHNDRPVFGLGLDMRHIAISPAHGYYYETRDEEPSWKFQRPALFTTIEDLNMYEYAYRYLIPMLENAGAIVVSPRERSPQESEIITDNDLSHIGSKVVQKSGKWSVVKGGFQIVDSLKDENPHTEGSYMVAQGDAEMEYHLKLPKSGKYGVTVSYKTLATNKSKVTYIIEHLRGVSEVEVNQRMMGSTWVYLGEWNFPENVKITLKGSGEGTITADAVRLGGGMGSVVRGGEFSNMPRWAESSRYYMQYSGAPKSVYRVGEKEHLEDPRRDTDAPDEQDYADDYKGRGEWVNWLYKTQKAPLDAALSIHSNAGANDTIFGTLAIHYTDKRKGVLSGGNSKLTSRDFADLVLTQIVDDMRALHTSQWTRRSLYDKSYAEISRPVVPSLLVEMFSHQSANDMKYGMEPQFRYNMSRAIYKGILKFIATRYQIPYVVQPLPITTPKMKMRNDTSIRLSWSATTDPLEPTAKPTHYKLYTATGEHSEFDNGTIIRRTHIDIPITKDSQIRRYRITALNQGGESFPSVVVSCAFSPSLKNYTEVKIIANEYKKLSAQSPYMWDLGYVGEVYDTDPLSPFIDNDAPGFGASFTDWATFGLKGEKLDSTTPQAAEILKSGGSYICL